MPKGVYIKTEDHKRKLSLALRGKYLGNESSRWKGDEVGYDALHRWVYRRLGEPRVCTHCHVETAKFYDWANISHKYRRNLDDWIRLCRVCHRNYDLGNISI